MYVQTLAGYTWNFCHIFYKISVTSHKKRVAIPSYQGLCFSLSLSTAECYKVTKVLKVMVKALFLHKHIYRTSKSTYHIRRTNAMPFMLMTEMPQYGVTPSFENQSLDDSKNSM